MLNFSPQTNSVSFRFNDNDTINASKYAVVGVAVAALFHFSPGAQVQLTGIERKERTSLVFLLCHRGVAGDSWIVAKG